MAHEKPEGGFWSQTIGLIILKENQPDFPLMARLGASSSPIRDTNSHRWLLDDSKRAAQAEMSFSQLTVYFYLQACVRS